MSGSNSSFRDAGVTPEAVSFTVHAVNSPQLADAGRRTVIGRLKMLAVLAVCASPVIASYFTYFVVRPQGRTNYSELITPPRGIPSNLPLQTLSGEAIAAANLQGQWLIVVAADAACDAGCERNLYLQRQLRETLGREMDRVDKVWFVTGPGMPKAALLNAIEQGTPTNVLRVPEAELAKWLEPAAGHTLAQHMYVVDPMGRWMMRVPPDPDPAKLKRDLDRLLRASASWDEPGRRPTP